MLGLDQTAFTVVVTAGGVLAVAGVWVAGRAHLRRRRSDLPPPEELPSEPPERKAGGR